MQKMILLSLVIAVTLLAGCGSNQKRIDQLRAEQDRALRQLREDVHVLGNQVRGMLVEINQLDSDLFELRSHFEYGPIGMGTGVGSSSGEETSGREAEDVSSPLNRHVEQVPIQPIAAKDLESLAMEVAKLRADVETLRLQFEAEKEIAVLRDPRETWNAMNDPEKLTWRLDRFERVWSRTIEDEAKREEFVAEMTQIKERVNWRAGMSTPELLEHYRAKLTERANSEGNQRVRHYFEQQLSTLDSDNQKLVEGHLQTYKRYDFAEDLRVLTSKHNISMDELRDNGLQTYGSPHGWQSSR